MVAVRAVYENGHLRLLDPVELAEGQEIIVRLEKQDERAAVRAALGDLIRPANPDDNRDAWVEDEAQNIEDAFRGTRPLSEIIIEERESGW
jgi:predicted DNA-binding antitoxin AbrB/MazE fold protein